MRDLLRGLGTFGELAAAPERVPTNILAERLQRLAQEGLITRVPYQHRPTRFRYVLTAMGRDLRPVLAAMTQWSEKHQPGVASFETLGRLARGPETKN